MVVSHSYVNVYQRVEDAHFSELAINHAQMTALGGSKRSQDGVARSGGLGAGQLGHGSPIRFSIGDITDEKWDERIS